MNDLDNRKLNISRRMIGQTVWAKIDEDNNWEQVLVEDVENWETFVCRVQGDDQKIKVNIFDIRSVI
jgi:hypothetical protein